MKQTLSVHLGSKRKSWDKFCELIDKSPSSYLADLAKTELRNKFDESTQKIKEGWIDKPKVEQREDTDRVRCVVTFRKSELDGVKKLAEREGQTAQEFIVSVMRRVVTGLPTFNSYELDVLRLSNNELSQMGLDIDQMGRQLSGQKDRISLDLLERFISDLNRMYVKINKHTDFVSMLISSNLRRWRIVNE